MRLIMRGSSPILITAALSIAVLVAATGALFGDSSGAQKIVIPSSLEPAEPRTYVALEDKDENGTPDWQDELQKSGILVGSASTSATSTTSSDPLSTIALDVAGALYGGYLSLKQYGSYTQEQGNDLAQNVAKNIRAKELFVPHTVEELNVDEDTSVKNALRYRADLRVALAGMVNDELPEFELFAHYLETKDAVWLEKITAAALRYEEAKENMLSTSVPKDAVPEHLRAINALGMYGDTLKRMSLFANDAMASAALLRTYNDNEEELLRAFDALAQYYVRTVANN